MPPQIYIANAIISLPFQFLGEKPFACNICGKSFRQKAHLAKHYQTHLAQKNTISTKGSSKQLQLRAQAAAVAATAVQQSAQQTMNCDPMIIAS